jgi:hypothetical protein
LLGLTALLISVAALVVSWVALYLTVLKPAEIEIDHVSSPNELSTTGFSGSVITGHVLHLTVFISNTGAHGGLLEDAHIDDLERHGRGKPLWTSLGKTHPLERLTGAWIRMPLVLEAGDVEAVLLRVQPEGMGLAPEEEAKRIGGMDRIAVTIHWAFFRTGGLLPARWRVIPDRFRRRRERILRSTRVEVDASQSRADTISLWRTQPHGVHLADIAEGKGWYLKSG